MDALVALIVSIARPCSRSLVALRFRSILKLRCLLVGCLAAAPSTVCDMLTPN